MKYFVFKSVKFDHGSKKKTHVIVRLKKRKRFEPLETVVDALRY